MKLLYKSILHAQYFTIINVCSISATMSTHVNGILSTLLSEVSEEPSVQGILLQARYGLIQLSL